MDARSLQLLLDYHYWARDRLFGALEPLTPEQFTRDLGSSFRSIRDTVAHMYSSEWTWYSRWQGTSPAAHVPFDQFPDVPTLRARWVDLEGRMRSYVEQLDESAAARVIEYRLLDGTPSATPFWQMLQHVVNHGSYHRGQVTTLLRQVGAPPARPMDLIAYYRSSGLRSEG